jgi:hypothetical protein
MKAILRVGARRAAPAAAAALALACGAAAPARGEPPRTIAEPGEGAGKVAFPAGLAVDQESGDLFVADDGNFRLDRFDSEGGFLLAWGVGVADGKSRELQVCGPAAEPPAKRCFKGTGGGADAATDPGAVAAEAVAVDNDPASASHHDVYVASIPNPPREGYVSKFTPSGGLVYRLGPDVTYSGPGNGGADETQALTVKATAGTFALSLTAPAPLGRSAAGQSTAPIPYDASHEEVQEALEALPGVEAGDLAVTGGPGDATGSAPYEVHFSGGPYAGNYVAPMKADSSALVGSQTVSVQGATGGAFTLTFRGKTTAPIPFDASHEALQEALEALATIGAGNVSVAGEAGGPWTVSFAGALAGSPQPAISASRKGEGYELTPSTATVSVAPPATVATPSPGGGPEVCEPARGDTCKAAAGSGERPGEFTNPRAVAVGPGGDLWLSDEGRVQRFDPDGAFLEEVGLEGIGFVYDLALDPATMPGGFYAVKGRTRSSPVPYGEGVAGEEGVHRFDSTGAEAGEADVVPHGPGAYAKAIATDAAGYLYVADRPAPEAPAVLRRLDPSGELVSQFGAGQVAGRNGPRRIAVDEGSEGPEGRPATLYVATQEVVQAFSLPEPGPLPSEPRAEGVLPTEATLAATLNPEGHTTHYSFQYLTEEAYEANVAEAKPGFEGAEETPERVLPGTEYEEEEVRSEEGEVEGLLPDTEYRFRVLATNSEGQTEAEATFATLPAVGIEAQWAAEVSARSATLEARLDPLGAEATWWLEYGTSPCEEGGCVRAAEGTLPASFGPIAVGEALSGLAPATAYHYRFAATDEREVREGGETLTRTFTAYGPEQSFATQPAGLGLSLPDGRAWEMVSPPEKHGGRIVNADPGVGGPVQGAADGEALAYLSYGSLEADPEGNRASEQSSQLSRRTPGGAWSTADITPPHTGAGRATVDGLEYRLLSADLGRALLEPRGAVSLSPLATERTPYLRQNTSPPAYTPLLVGCPPAGEPCPAAIEEHADVPPGTAFGGGSGSGPPVKVIGADRDFSHVVLSSSVPLAAGVEGSALYEWAGGSLTPLSVVSREGEEEVVQGTLGSDPSTVRGSAVSADGARVFWGGEGSGGNGLYVRDTAREETVRLDEVREGAFGTGEAKPLFQAASADGRIAFFTDSRNLTADANEEGADLYRWAAQGAAGCEAPGGCLADTSAETKNPEDPLESAFVQGLAPGIGEDGARAYFVARGVLDPEPNAHGESASAGQPNLYAWREGEGTRFVATLAEEDKGDWGFGHACGLCAFNLTAAASPNGRYLAFMSRLPLTGYDNRDVSDGERAQEVFRYDSQSEALACVSCNPAGARPLALRPAGYGPEEALDPQHLWEGTAVAALLPEATKIGGSFSLYRPRAVGDDGRVFFNAADSLVPADSNAAGDVYEYEPTGVGTCTPSSAGAGTAIVPGGCVSLLSSGTGEGAAAFLDASEGGRDVFLYTTARLSVTDEDGEMDVYDAREGGTPATLSPLAECLGEACQPPAVPPALQTPASATFRGPGNLREGGAGAGRCAKPAHRAGRLARRARGLRKSARRAKRAGSSRLAKRRARKATGLAKRAHRLSKRARRCRRANRRSAR